MSHAYLYASMDGEIFIACRSCNWSKELGSEPTVSDVVFAKLDHLKECGR